MTAFTLAILFPNYKHIESYKVPTVFNADEVEVLSLLGKKANREDYVIAWWDYGYPIRYYTDVKTLVDGGRHNGDVNFPVSYILTHNQQAAAKMARLDVEYTERTYALKDAKKAGTVDKNLSIPSNIEQMTKDYGFKDTNNFLATLHSDIKLPKKSRDIYFYLPYRMLNIYPTISLFSNLDLMSGKRGKPPFFYVSQNIIDMGDKIQLGRGIFLNKRNSTLQLGRDTLPIRRFVQTEYDNNMHLRVTQKIINLSSDISVIFMASYNTFVIVDEKTYHSLYVQLFILQNYDKKLFEPVILSPGAKVYKLKI
jgi:dolichyl-diphosphooligosaccharide--protein glycosyltransferase/undecaprenyl-diphosphooligosaccharide--protein glycosyltransferase